MQDAVERLSFGPHDADPLRPGGKRGQLGGMLKGMGRQVRASGRMRRCRGSIATGILVFLAGIGMMLFAFKLAFDLYNVPPSVRVDAVAGQPIDLTKAGETLTQTVIRIVVIAVMAALGGMVANRGISMYASTRRIPKKEAETKSAKE